MKKVSYILLLIVLISCKSETKSTKVVAENTKETVKTTASEATPQTDIPVLNFEQFEKYLNIEDDNIHVVNFWATWCAPCVKELPYFEAVNQEYKDKNVKVLLVSLDFNLKKLNSFLAKNKLQSEQVLLDDPDQNAWIPKVSKEWSGAIPATVIYKKGKRKFYEHSFTKAELESELRNFIN
ncbi:thiol-disulfide isomerase/thioredoxin [Kordia periserrulae]|uniref:Thiol-disulfide isomerase/thioredoxin n=1 Tax=Kordia periserrulae TaxID=701523 RepID=A0A2T6C574_9FLAO|nr:TlpA disulfide reductase family protein [Kordia periserrulae]PTX63432.1 thiol-disulfide isomerase/thioredoxin [Kordia periserrulae]